MARYLILVTHHFASLVFLVADASYRDIQELLTLIVDGHSEPRRLSKIGIQLKQVHVFWSNVDVFEPEKRIGHELHKKFNLFSNS